MLCAAGAPTDASSAADNGMRLVRGDSEGAASSTASSPPPQQQAAGQTLRKKSVSFADEPALSAAQPAEAPQGRGMKKGFLDRPRPALKKTSSTESEEVSSSQQEVPPDAASQRLIDEGRDAAFSGSVVEREPEALQQSSGGHHHGGDVPANRGTVDALLREGAKQLRPTHEEVAPQAPAGAKKVSRFRQQRAGLSATEAAHQTSFA